jgi:hypothetical protein
VHGKKTDKLRGHINMVRQIGYPDGFFIRWTQQEHAKMTMLGVKHL